MLCPISGPIFIFLRGNKPDIMDLTDLVVSTITVPSLKYETEIFYKTLKM